MSNCIDIHNPELFFSDKEIDLPRFRATCERLRLTTPWHLNGETDQEIEDRNFAWFLASNSEFLADGVVIRFGQGKSSHTNRDLRGVVEYLLPKYLLRAKVHTFVVSDEFDGFKERFKHTVVFKPKRSK